MAEVVVCESCRQTPATVLVFVDGAGFRTCTECAAAGIKPSGAGRVQFPAGAEPAAVTATGTVSASTTGVTTTRGLLW